MARRPPAPRLKSWPIFWRLSPRQQDRAAFSRLFRHFAPRLKAYVMRGGGDPAVAEEIVQECMVTVWRKAGTYDRSKANVSTWMFTIARNKRIDRLRRENRPMPSADDLEDLSPAAQPADERHEAGLRREKIRTAMAGLPPEQIEVLEKAFFEDLSHQAVAMELGLPLGTVKSRIRLALVG